MTLSLDNWTSSNCTDPETQTKTRASLRAKSSIENQEKVKFRNRTGTGRVESRKLEVKVPRALRVLGFPRQIK